MCDFYEKEKLRFSSYLGAKVRCQGSPGAARAQMYNFNKLVGAQVTGWKGNEMKLSVLRIRVYMSNFSQWEHKFLILLTCKLFRSIDGDDTDKFYLGPSMVMTSINC